MNASILTNYIMATATNASNYITAMPPVDPMMTFYMLWGTLIFMGLVEAARAMTGSPEEPAKPDAWVYVGDHPGLKTPSPVYRKDYDSGKSAFRWRKSDKSPWTYGSDPMEAY